MSLEYAVRVVFERYMETIATLDNSYLRERTTDVKDAAQRLLETLSGGEGHQYDVPDDAILVAQDLSPADLCMLEGDKFKGIVLATGGVTSHASILAKSFEIPTVVGVDHLLESVCEGDEVVVDGNAGVVYINPSVEVVREYERIASFRSLLTLYIASPVPTCK